MTEDDTTVKIMFFIGLFLFLIPENVSSSEIDHGYFDFVTSVDVQPAYTTEEVSLPVLSETGIFRCLSTCLYTDGCWAVKLYNAPSNGPTTKQCMFYTLEQPPSILIDYITSDFKIALRRWNPQVGIQYKLSETCEVYLLTGENVVPDENFNCSSFVYDYKGWNYHMAKYSRLNNDVDGAGAWCASQESGDPEWLQVFLGNVRLLTGVVTQGREKDDSYKWVTSYYIKFSNDGINWNDYNESGSTRNFSGNTDRSTAVKNMFQEPVYAAYMRVYPSTWEEWACMRFDVLGC